MASFLLASSRAASRCLGDSPTGHADLHGSPGLGLTQEQEQEQEQGQGRTRVSRHAGEFFWNLQRRRGRVPASPGRRTGCGLAQAVAALFAVTTSSAAR